MTMGESPRSKSVDRGYPLLGPLAGALVTYVNLKRLGQGRKGRLVFGWSIVATVPLFAALIYLPAEITKVLGVAVEGTGAALFPWLQKQPFEKWEQANPGAVHANKWKSVGWGLLGMVLVFVVFMGLFVGQNVVSQSFNERGEKLESQNQFAEAEKQFRLAARLDPDYAQAHTNLGVALRRKGDLDGAIAKYREAIRLEPDDAEAHSNLGIALYDKGDGQAALEEFRRASELDPKNAAIRENYERLSKELKK